MIPVEQKAAEVQAQASVVLVEEYDRVDLNLRKRQVEASQVTKPHSLDTVCQASPTARQAILLEILGVPESALCVVPLHLKMAIAVTVFWQREANPTPTPLQLHALLMGFVYGELNLQHDSGPQQNLSQDRGLNAALTRQRIRAGERRGLDLSDAHAYSQWQACLWAALCLNQLLLQALPEPCLSWVFSGTLVHGLAKYLKEGRTPESMLHKSILSEQLFSSLLDTVNKCVIRKTTPKSASSKRSGRRRKGGSARGNTATKEINNRFALLKDEEDT
uniref:Uncharacterized protein n=1 Tax=Knipowitschia caucasica TaxID=637954 RepID=A0AAV2K860_KNICA